MEGHDNPEPIILGPYSILTSVKLLLCQFTISTLCSFGTALSEHLHSYVDESYCELIRLLMNLIKNIDI
jgi:hypothetical protein